MTQDLQKLFPIFVFFGQIHWKFLSPVGPITNNLHIRLPGELNCLSIKGNLHLAACVVSKCCKNKDSQSAWQGRLENVVTDRNLGLWEIIQYQRSVLWVGCVRVIFATNMLWVSPQKMSWQENLALPPSAGFLDPVSIELNKLPVAVNHRSGLIHLASNTEIRILQDAGRTFGKNSIWSLFCCTRQANQHASCFAGSNTGDCLHTEVKSMLLRFLGGSGFLLDRTLFCTFQLFAKQRFHRWTLPATTRK